MLDDPTAPWLQLGPPGSPGLGSTVLSLAIDATHLYAGGSFTSPQKHVARLQLSTPTAAWEGLGPTGDQGLDSDVSCMQLNATHLYVGGSFAATPFSTQTNLRVVFLGN